MNPGREPVAVRSPDGHTVPITKGARVVRRPIFQARFGGSEPWAKELVDRITVAKSLGFTMFEIDVTSVKVEAEVQSAGDTGYPMFSIFGTISRPVIEGDEWKRHAAVANNLRNDQVITVYALVVE